MKNYFILGPTSSGKTGFARKLLYGQKYSVSRLSNIFPYLPRDFPETTHIVEKIELENGYICKLK